MENNNSQLQLNQMCRACMSKNTNYSIYDEAKNKIPIYKMLAAATPQLAIQNDDELPKKICSTCLIKLINVHKFQDMCIASDKYMRNQLVNSISTSIREQDSKEAATVQNIENLYFTIKVEMSDEDEEAISQSDFYKTGEDIQDNRLIMEFEPSDVKVEECNLESNLFTKNVESEAIFFKREDDFNDNSMYEALAAENESDYDYDTRSMVSALSSACDGVYQEQSAPKGRKTKQKQPTGSSNETDTPKIEKFKANSKRKSIFHCIHCNAFFYNKYMLNQHVRSHTEVYPFICKICDYRCKTAEPLAIHTKLVHETPPPGGFECPNCTKCFKTRLSLACHKKIHKSTSSVCDYCDESFQNNQLLCDHLKSNSCKRTYQCPECPSNFTYKSDRTRHMNSHRCLKPYSCKICGSSFTRYSSLIRHNIVHTGEKQYKCNICDMMFSRIYNMQRHQSKMHIDDKP